jgi:hypothetical protein
MLVEAMPSLGMIGPIYPVSIKLSGLNVLYPYMPNVPRAVLLGVELDDFPGQFISRLVKEE